jgi:hypothetical protein
MKKITLLTAAIAIFCSANVSFAQNKSYDVNDRPWGVAPWEYAAQMDSHIEFEGIELGQAYDTFINELSGKGFKTLDKQKRFTIMRGTWKGISDTKIVVYHKGGRTHLVEVYPRAVKGWDQAKALYEAIRKDFFQYSGLNEENLANLTDHNLNIGHEDDFNMRALHKEFDNANCAWETILPMPEGTLTVNINGKKDIGNAKARYTKGHFQVHAIYRDNCREDITLDSTKGNFYAQK